MQWEVLKLTLKVPKIQDKLKLLSGQKWYLFLSVLNAVNNGFRLRKAHLPKICIRLMHSSITRSPLGRRGTEVVVCFLAVLCCIPPGAEGEEAQTLALRPQGHPSPWQRSSSAAKKSVPVLGKDSRGKSEGSALLSFLGLYPTASWGSPDNEVEVAFVPKRSFLFIGLKDSSWIIQFFLLNSILLFTPVKSHDDYTCWIFKSLLLFLPVLCLPKSKSKHWTWWCLEGHCKWEASVMVTYHVGLLLIIWTLNLSTFCCFS